MQAILHLINEMSPYLLLGFLLAGLMHAFIPGQVYTRYLARPTLGSVVRAALFGIPLPLCSCGVIPTAMSLRREGASKGAVTAFLIATPQTGVDSIIATYGLMGLPFALVRPLAALLTSVLGGALSNAAEPAGGAPPGAVSAAQGDHRAPTLAGRLLQALRYAFVDMMEDIGKWLVVGLVAAGLITVFVPDEAFQLFQGNTLASMLLVLAIAMPMYLCATGSIPVAVALMLKGLTPGAALVLLMAGPACNFASMLVVRKALGTRSLLVYLASIIAGAVAFGVLVDYLQFGGHVDFLRQLTLQQACHAEAQSWLSWGGTLLLALFLLNALVLRPLIHRGHAHAHPRGSNAGSPADTIVCHIEGMNCNHCRTSAEKALQGVPGVTSASVDLQSREARITGSASAEALSQAISEVGFKLVP